MGIIFHQTGVNLVRFISGCASELSAVILPTKRAVREFIGFRQGTSAAPDLFTYEEFFNSLPDTGEYIAAEKFIKNLFLREAVSNIKDSEKIMKNDFEYIKDITMLESFIDDLGSFYREVAAGQVDFDRLKRFSVYTEYYNHISILEEIWKRYIELLHQNGFTDIAMLKAAGDIKKITKYNDIYLAASGFLTDFETGAIKKLSDMCSFHIVAEKSRIPKKMEMILKRVVPELKSVAVAEDKVHANIEVKRFSTKSAMAGWIIRTVRYEYYHNAVPLNNIRVVLPDESMADMLRVFDREMFNFANGFRLDESVYYSYIKALYDLNENRTADLYGSVYLIKLLNHPFSNSRTGRALLSKIYKDGMPAFSISDQDLKALSLNRFSRIYHSELITLQNVAKELLEILRERSKEYEKHNPPVDYRKAAETLFDELERLSILNEKFVALKSSGANILRYILKRLKSIRFPDAGIGRVKVIGMLEARLLEQDVVIIPSLNDGILPKQIKKELFLNSVIRKECGLPVTTDREELQQYYFRSIIRSSKTAYLAYLEGDGLSMSKFLSDIIQTYDLKVETDNMMINYVTGKDRIVAKQLKAPADKIEKNDLIMEKLRTMKFSAYAIDSYRKCPYQFYLRYIKGIPKKSSFDDYPFELGNIVHSALAELYKDGKTINNETVLRKRFSAIFGRIKDENKIIGCDPSYRIKADYFLYKIENSDFFHNEASCAADKIIAEPEFSSSIDAGSAGEVKFIGRADRINLYRDHFEIIDYKTGNIGRYSAAGKNYSVQLPVYGFVMRNRYALECSGLFYYDLNNFKKIDFGNANAAWTTSELIEQVMKEIKTVIEEIFDRSRPFAKIERHCAFCDYRAVCRKYAD
ncbi:MAG: Dna2/Cas4 domain-containing protein [Epsilonproteobacteria bacterium]|nr:Dna2/Cas4 domain-containing protein [Campylobacterota bacterium]